MSLPDPIAARVDLDDLGAALVVIRASRAELDRAELIAVDRARDRGWTWDEIAKVWGVGSRQASQQRHAKLRAAADAAS